MNTNPTRWFDLGPYKILQHPLTSNPYWSCFWIYRAGKLLGKLLSVPSLADCEHVERWGEHYAEPADTKRISYRLRGAVKRRAVPAST